MFVLQIIVQLLGDDKQQLNQIKIYSSYMRNGVILSQSVCGVLNFSKKDTKKGFFSGKLRLQLRGVSNRVLKNGGLRNQLTTTNLIFIS
jgi:hypothetical protein